MARLCQSLVIITAIFVLTFAPAFAATFNYSSSGSTAIPDGTGSNVCGTTVTRSINVTDSFTIGDLNVGLIISHTYKEDLLISLQSPNGTNVTIVNREGEGFDNFNIRLDDSETNTIQSIDHVTTNPYPSFQRQPLSPLSAFNSENAIGTWTLSVQDCWNADTGALLDFYLEFTDTAGTNPLIVTTTADTNTIGTLRYAINHANANASDDNITFNIPGLGPHVIDPATALPTITDDGVSIDGSTQGSVVCDGTPNATGGMSNRKHYIVLFGSNHTDNAINISGANNVTIKGLTIGNSAQDGLNANNVDGLTLLCNHFGASTDTTGNIGNVDNGAFISNSDNLVIGDGTLAGANIFGFNGVYGLEVNNSNNANVKRNFIGAGADGSSDIGNSSDGLRFTGSTTNSTIGDTTGGGNVLSGNGSDGLDLANVTSATILGNFIGSNGAGTATLPNDDDGINLVNSTSILVGNGTVAGRNIISGNGTYGILIDNVSDASILGNYIGVALDGTTDLGNADDGIHITNSTNTTIGNGTASGRNVIGGNEGMGIASYNTTTGLSILGNFIGVDVSGNIALANGANEVPVARHAIEVGNGTASNITISDNVIGGYDRTGVIFWDVSGTNNIITGNNIGVGANGISDITTALGFEFAGIGIGGATNGGSVDLTIGGMNTGEGNLITNGGASGIFTYFRTGVDILGNTIRDNANNGVDVAWGGATSITGNSIFNNGGLGIDLDADGVTGNDGGDADAGANDRLNYPVINDFGASGSTFVNYDINLDLPSNPQGYRIDFFKNANLETYGQGEFYLGSVDVVHAGGNLNFDGSFTANINVSAGEYISATTTRKTGPTSFDITSEFSETYTATVFVDPLIVTSTADTNTIGTLRFAVNHANANLADDNITFNIAGTGPHKITLSSALPKITDDDVTIDGSTHPGASCGQLTNGTQHTLMVHIDGATAGADAYGMEILGANVSVKALSITNFDGYGLYAWSGGASNFVGDCLYIGVEPDGTTTGANVTVDNRSPGILFTNVSNLTLRNSLVSGHNDDAGDYGVRFDHVTGAIVQGNIIGLNANGNGALGNSGKGIQIDGSSSGIMIGGTTVATRNIISGNGGSAIRVRNTASNVTIIGNHIGVGVDGTTAFGNGSHGVFVQEGAVVTIGDGTTAGGNIIANNTSDGVSTGGSNTGTLAILSNQFYSNGGLGIDLGNDGLTANDGGDGDTGANELLNFPLLNEVKADGTTSIDYDVNLDAPSNANGYRVEFFKNTTADPSGYGEGEVYLGFVDIAHSGGDLNFTGSLTATMTVNVGDIISATTTRKTGTLTYDITSEFSQNVTTVDANPASLTVAKTVAPLNAGDYDLPGNDVVYTFVVTNEGVGAVDADSIILIDSLPPEIIFYNGDHDGPGPSTDVVGFEESSTSLTFNPSTDAFFSNGTTKPADLSECDYTPTAGYDPNVKYVCFNPKGTMQGGDPNPVFNIRFRATIQ